MTINAETNAHRRYALGDLELDLDRRSVQRAGVDLDLPELSFGLLATLVRHAPDRVSKDQLIREVWGDIVVSDETLAQRVRLLRQALGEDSQQPRYLTSVRGRGYRLICKVKRLPDLDTRRLSVGRWVFLAALTVLVASGLWVLNGARQPQDTRVAAESLAVLPFRDLSSGQEYQYFADGMQEELLTRLTMLDNLNVVSRTSVEKYRSSELSLANIADELGTDAVIEGSIRIAADRVRITVQLIDAATDGHLWAENFDRELTVANIFSIQEEVADQIATALQRADYRIAVTNSNPLPTNSLEAYDAYLLGRYHTFRPTPDNLDLAVTYLEKAISIDKEFAEAHATLGWAYSFLGTTYGSLSPHDALPKAREAALRALALDGNLASARSLYADILTWYDWDFEAAEREHAKALELDPGGTLGYALFLSTQGRHVEAVSLVERPIVADPTDTWSWVNAAWRYLNYGRIDQAIEAAIHAKDHPDAKSVLGLSYLAADQMEQAIRVFEGDIRIQGRNPQQLSNLAYAYFKNGQIESGELLLSELHELAEINYVSPALLAAVYFAAGDADTGFAMLEDAINARSREVIFVQVSQMLNGYRDDPRYLSLVETIGFETAVKSTN